MTLAQLISERRARIEAFERDIHGHAEHGALLAAGLSARTVGHGHWVLRLVLQCAVKNGTLSRNVAGVHKPPKVEEREVEILCRPIRSRTC